MQELNRLEDFKPSQKGLQWWLSTRKSKFKPTNNPNLNKAPGLFLTTGFSVDFILLFVAIGLDAYGLYKIFEYTGDIIILLGLLLGDIVLAIFAHIPRATILRKQNEIWHLKYKFDTGRINDFAREFNGNMNNLKSTKSKALFFEYFFVCLIIVLTGYKINSFLYNSGLGPFEPESRFLLLSYILVAGIHIYATGYAISAIATELIYWIIPKSKHTDYRKNNKIHPKYTISKPGFDLWATSTKLNEFNDHIESLLTIHNFDTIDSKNLIPNQLKTTALFKIDDNLLKIPKISELFSDYNLIESDKQNIYLFYNWGILTDKDLRDIVSSQLTDSAREEATFFLIGKQLTQLNGSN